MISVRDFVQQSSVWRQVAPMLEQVTRWSNTSQESLGGAVDITGSPQRSALISETAFYLASSSVPYLALTRGREEMAARATLMQLPNGQPSAESLSLNEWTEAHKLSRTIQRYTAGLQNPRFSPAIPGCGVVVNAIGDVVAGSELVEIKAVTRPFRSTDIRQALTYAAMFYAARTRIDRITLLNPRRAKYVSTTIDAIAYQARGESGVELVQDIVEWMFGLQVSA